MLQYFMIFCPLSIYGSSQGSVIVTWTKAMGWKVKGQNHSRAKIIFFQKISRLPLGPTQPHIEWVSGSSLGVKELECVVDHWCLSGAEVKNTWSFTSSPVHDVDTPKHTHLLTYTHTHTLTYPHTLTLTHTHMCTSYHKPSVFIR